LAGAAAAGAGASGAVEDEDTGLPLVLAELADDLSATSSIDEGSGCPSVVMIGCEGEDGISIEDPDSHAVITIAQPRVVHASQNQCMLTY